jgi:hypothetical protein
MQLQMTVGPASIASLPQASTPNLRSGQLGDLIVTELQGRYYEGAYRKQRFNAANQAGTTTSVGLATAYTGLCLSNPIGSNVNLVLEKLGYSFSVAFAAGSAIGLMTGYSSTTNVTHTTPGTPRSNFVGVGTPGQGLIDTSCTLPIAPVVSMVFTSGLTGAITTQVTTPGEVVDLDGGYIIPPGGYAAIYTSTASGAAGFFGSLQWSEIPV